jgi:hypothetical protein
MLKNRCSCMACVVILLLFASLMVPILFFTASASAQQPADELTVVTVEGISKSDNPSDAIKEITAKAIADTAREQVIEILGEKKYQKSKVVIENKVIRESAKFIPFVNPGEPLKVDGGYKVSIQLKISQGSLAKIISSAGLLVDSEGPGSLLSLVSITDQIHAADGSYAWWASDHMDSGGNLVQLSTGLNQSLFSEFSRQGFYVLRPQGPSTVHLIPENWRVPHLRVEDLKPLGEYLQMAMIIRGDIRLYNSSAGSEAALKLDVVQARNGKVIADVTRTVALEKGLSDAAIRTRLNAQFIDLSKDLAAQVLEVWQRGTLGSNSVTLSVRGRLNPKQLKQFKSEIIHSVHEIKALRERFFEPGRVVFEMEYNGASAQMSDRFKSVALASFGFQVSDVSEKGVTADVKAK